MSLELKDIERIFVNILVDNIRHVRRFEKTRKILPSQQELLGEFCTNLRRNSLELTEIGFPRLGFIDFWSGVAIPRYTNVWYFIYKGLDGVREMGPLHATKLCELALEKAYEAKEITAKLYDLDLGINRLQIFVSEAKKLNDTADLILSDLCVTAEKLQ